MHLSAARVIEESAIPYLAFLSKADFDSRFPGELVEDRSTLEPGWYVTYEHESLVYFFGPILLESTSRDYLSQLEEIVAKAVAQRPSIQGYRMELSYEPTQASIPGGGQGDSGERSDSSAGASPSQPPSSMGIWGFFKRLFGL